MFFKFSGNKAWLAQLETEAQRHNDGLDGLNPNGFTLKKKQHHAGESVSNSKQGIPLGFQAPLKQWVEKYNHHCLPKGFNHPNWVNRYFNGGGSPGEFESFGHFLVNLL